MSTKQTPTQRKPGRPKIDRSIDIKKYGVVDTPTDPSNRLEFTHSDPGIFKLLFTYFKGVKARDLHVRCNATGLTFFSRDHSATSRIVAEIAGRNVNWYYCDGEFWLYINRENVEKMFSTIDKTFSKITIAQMHDDVNNLTVLFKDSMIDKECVYKINLSSFQEDADLYAAEQHLTEESLQTNYPITFSLSDKHFKKTISDACQHSDNITFEKIGTSPLCLTYVKNTIIYNEIYRSESKIGLVSTIEEGHIFRATIKLDNIKPLAASMVSERICIYCREDDYILFRSAFDDNNALVVSTLTSRN